MVCKQSKEASYVIMLLLHTTAKAMTSKLVGWIQVLNVFIFSSLLQRQLQQEVILITRLQNLMSIHRVSRRRRSLI
jgi:hypothetical protein